jgi:pimeloyl-ACP methyl ester carboxylesterase
VCPCYVAGAMTQAVEGPKLRRFRVRANGLEHSVLEWAGGGAASRAMLLHGFMDAGANWQPVASRLAENGLRVLAPDLRGFGETHRAPAGSYYHFADYVADVAGLIEALAPARPDELLLVGHSMGGTIATMYAGAFPERVTKLALLEGLGPPAGELGSLPDRLRRWVEQTVLVPPRDRGVGTMDDAFRRLAANHPRVATDVLHEKLANLVLDLGHGRVGWRADPLHKTNSPTPFFTEGYVACARRIPCPVLHVSGGPDGFHVDDEATRLDAFRSLERVTLPTAGHMMHWTDPMGLSDALLRFWRTPGAS